MDIFTYDYLKLIQDYYNSGNTAKVSFIIAATVVAMVVDMITGWAKAIVKRDVSSSVGKKGIMFKVSQFAVMVLLVIIHVVIPPPLGYTLMYTALLGFLVFELVSIVENLSQMGINIKPLTAIVEYLRIRVDKQTRDIENRKGDEDERS